MAEGFIYILTNPAFKDGLLKIGKTTRTPSKRAREMSTTGVPAEFEVSFEIQTLDCDYAEALIHSRFSKERFSSKREFFQVPIGDAIAIVTDTIKKVENTSLEERIFVPRQEKVSLPIPIKKKNYQPRDLKIYNEIQNNTAFIKKATNTIFRQNDQMLDGAGVFYKLTGYSWSNEKETKEAMVYFSRPSKTLVIIPKDIVDNFILTPFFQKTSEGIFLKDQYQYLDYDNGRIHLKFKTDNDRLTIFLKALAKFNVDPIPLISLSKPYWPEIDFKSENPAGKLVDEIKTLCDRLSLGEGIISIANK